MQATEATLLSPHCHMTTQFSKEGRAVMVTAYPKKRKKGVKELS